MRACAHTRTLTLSHTRGNHELSNDAILVSRAGRMPENHLHTAQPQRQSGAIISVSTLCSAAVQGFLLLARARACECVFRLVTKKLLASLNQLLLRQTPPPLPHAFPHDKLPSAGPTLVKSLYLYAYTCWPTCHIYARLCYVQFKCNPA